MRFPLVYQRRHLISGVMLLVAMVSALLLSLPRTPYISTATIGYENIDAATLDREAVRATSPEVVSTVLSQLNLLQYREFRPSGTDKNYATQTREHLDAATAIILPKLTTVLVQSPPTLTISFSGRSKDGTMAFLNRLVKLHLESKPADLDPESFHIVLLSPPTILEYHIYPFYYYGLLVLSIPLGLVAGVVFSLWVNYRQK